MTVQGREHKHLSGTLSNATWLSPWRLWLRMWGRLRCVSRGTPRRLPVVRSCRQAWLVLGSTGRVCTQSVWLQKSEQNCRLSCLPFGVIVTLLTSNKVRTSAKLSCHCRCGIITEELQKLNCFFSERPPKVRATIEFCGQTAVGHKAEQITEPSV